jgi:hypothetical protein
MGRRAAAAVTLLLAALLSGCAGTAPRQFVEEPGVTVRVRLTTGESLSGMLVAMESNVLVVDHSVPKSARVEIVRRDDSDIVVLAGTPIGRALEVRDVDVLVRQRFSFFEIEDVRVVSRGYLGWGTVIAAVLGFLLVKVLEANG